MCKPCLLGASSSSGIPGPQRLSKLPHNTPGNAVHMRGAVFSYLVEQADICARAGRAAESATAPPAGQAAHRSAGPALKLTLADGGQHVGSASQPVPSGTDARSGCGGAAAAPAAQRVDLRAPAKPARRRFLDCTIS